MYTLLQSRQNLIQDFPVKLLGPNYLLPCSPLHPLAIVAAVKIWRYPRKHRANVHLLSSQSGHTAKLHGVSHPSKKKKKKKKRRP